MYRRAAYGQFTLPNVFAFGSTNPLTMTNKNNKRKREKENKISLTWTYADLEDAYSIPCYNGLNGKGN